MTAAVAWGARAAAAGVMLAAAAPATAACSVSPQGVSFGSYDTLSSTALDGAGNINVTCDLSASFTVSLSTGGSGTFDPRRMAAGTDYLNYNLYTDAARLLIWGDGTTAGNVSSTGTNVDLPVYGRIPALQNVPANSYTDSITVTVSY